MAGALQENTWMTKFKTICAATVIAFSTAGTSQAAFVDAELPDNTFISFGGFDWAWASPVTADGSWGLGSEIDLSFQSLLGWRLPTAAELLGAPSVLDFVFAGANVPSGGTDPVSGAIFQAGSPQADAACAAPYFSNMFRHCDWTDGRGAGLGYDWAGTAGSISFSDQLVIRDQVPAPVPVPAAGSLLILGLGALAAMKRRKSA